MLANDFFINYLALGFLKKILRWRGLGGARICPFQLQVLKVTTNIQQFTICQ